MTEVNRSTNPTPAATPTELPLNSEQQAQAEALYRHPLQLSRSGARSAVLTFSWHLEPLRVGRVGRRVEIR